MTNAITFLSVLIRILVLTFVLLHSTIARDISLLGAALIMEGRSHLLVGLTAGVVIDSLFHISGAPLTNATSIPLALLANKAVYYFAVGFGALLPDIDNARSTLGNNLGFISKGIQRIAVQAHSAHLSAELEKRLSQKLERKRFVNAVAVDSSEPKAQADSAADGGRGEGG